VKKSRFSDGQIMVLLKQTESGTAMFCKWRSRFGGIDVSAMAKMKEFEDHNQRFEKPYIDAQIRALIVEAALEKK
jgi:putative transposase